MSAKATDYLTQNRIDQLSDLRIFMLAKDGFTLQDVRAMVSISRLYSSSEIIERIYGASVGEKHWEKNEVASRLSASQSAVAFQFARVLDHATTVFGNLQLAEEWLEKPCRNLAGNVPLDMVDNPLGFKVVEDYLERVALGIYQ
ncbi:antitoxin Xre/MbcA/ParS toxin-binding domain-containing protein [Pseudomonas azotoformans]|nr:antitoxin Xre/MbcA/ParS toxin-binding domain-containing protein [Pseudomonas azotoformans]